MEVFEQITTLTDRINDLRSDGKTIGFVPTMGALHEGHLSLIKGAKNKCDVVVVSIFVNPTQFNDSSDFDRYPRTLQRDLVRLENQNCDVLFCPTREEMYPREYKEHFEFGALTSVLEAAFRPGHFDGMATIVKRLLSVVKPDAAFFGEKDFQQLAIIKKMVEQEKLGIEIVGCPIVREKSGLAMSSRNERLSENEKNLAKKLSETLFEMRNKKRAMSPGELVTWGRNQLERAKGIKLEYLEIVDQASFRSVDEWNNSTKSIALVAAYVGDVRLIDNIKLSAVREEFHTMAEVK